ncbi:MAG: acyl-CoA dehydrogenase family protein [Myxococcota bacterium]|nr:acyl-CoA dehydrogenase family protein [Myxococcota bacterium]MDW8362341.1 acyl-CoA dehydrogenase family protein [Myxococcales bacterium]
MDLRFRPEHLAFRERVREFVATEMPPDLRAVAEVDGHFEHEQVMRWHRILYRKGWVAPHWPVEWGGAGLDPTERFILNEELELAGAPHLSPFGLYMVGPLLLQFGTDAQKRRFLPKILSGEEVWCQGYSEPGAGSDLASLRTTAVDDGTGHLIVNGQKTWTTYAQHADWMFCLVRTDPTASKPQAGISFLLVDMRSPGVTVRPMLTIGHTPAFCDTFLENVRVPKENVVGPLHGGWTLAKALLGHERTLIAAVGLSRRALLRVKRIAARTLDNGRPLLDDPRWRERIARLEVRLRALQVQNWRALWAQQQGRAPGPESSVLKIRGSELSQQILELAMDVMGPNARNWFEPPTDWLHPLEQWVGPSHCYARATTIYGGTNEIQRNVIAKLVLGLPVR